MRYRHGDSDFARIARQQAFLSELKRQSRSARGLDNIVDAIHDEVTTSLRSTSRLKDFLLFALETEKERIARVQVKATGSDLINGQSVVLTSQKQIRDAVDQWKNPDFISQAPAKPVDPSKVIVNVYNGSKRLRLGAKAGEALAKRGYKVYVGGNAPDGFYQSTSIFYAPDKRNEAKALQQLFGDRASIVARRKGQATDADVLVVIGSDYEGLVDAHGVHRQAGQEEAGHRRDHQPQAADPERARHHGHGHAGAAAPAARVRRGVHADVQRRTRRPG